MKIENLSDESGAAVPVASPCINVCRMSPFNGYCEGCFRTIDEIAGWTTCSDAEKLAVLARLPARKAER